MAGRINFTKNFYSKSGKHIKVKYILLISFLFLMNYKKEIPNVEWGNPHAAKDAYVMSYIDQDIQQWPTLPADKMVPGFAAGMDDLAQIVLNNKFKTKFNRNALTLPTHTHSVCSIL